MDYMGQVRLTLRGYNVERFVNYAMRQGINIINIKKIESGMILTISYSQYKMVKKSAKSFMVDRVEFEGLCKLVHYLSRHLGYVIGLVLGISLVLFSLSRVWRIEILGLERINQQTIIEILDEMQYNIGCSNRHIDNESIEDRLLKSLDGVSMVSVINNGCSIIINIKEKEYEIDLDQDLFVPLVAERDGVIESINVVQGTPMVHAGDVVKQGDILIAPFVVGADGGVTKMRALGEVKASVYVKGSAVYQQGAETLVRSGNMIIRKQLNIFGIDLPSRIDVDYEYYEIETSEKYLTKNLLLPFRITEERCYELVKAIQEETFNERKDYLIKESIYNAYENLQSNFEVLSEQTDITKVEQMYFVTTYLKVITNIATNGKQGEENGIL